MSNQVQNPNAYFLSLRGANGVSDEAIPHVCIPYSVLRMRLLRSPAGSLAMTRYQIQDTRYKIQNTRIGYFYFVSFAKKP